MSWSFYLNLFLDLSFLTYFSGCREEIIFCVPVNTAYLLEHLHVWEKKIVFWKAGFVGSEFLLTSIIKTKGALKRSVWGGVKLGSIIVSC